MLQHVPEAGSPTANLSYQDYDGIGWTGVVIQQR
jgi:hypothetical protein